jgi:threonine 3-dehydrogenase
MSRKPVTLITGANGEIGHDLIRRLAGLAGAHPVLALDLNPLDPELLAFCAAAVTGDIQDRRLLDRLATEYEIDAIYHLAALLSTRAEFHPELAHGVNVQGTLNLLGLAVDQARSLGRTVRFFFPSSIAVYGLPDARTRESAGPVREDEFTAPRTMYGCNKLYCEHLGRYFSRHYRQLAADEVPGRVDFRAIRFPGLISASTVPSGGTSDYAPEMVHAAARGEPYACFVREELRLPFMTMPDAVDAILALMAAPASTLRRSVYNISAFNPSAGTIAALVRECFPGADISFAPDTRRQAIVESWPAAVDDGAARAEWGFAPAHDLRRSFAEYLVPAIRRRYAGAGPQARPPPRGRQ